MEPADNPTWGPFSSPIHTQMGPTYKCWLGYEPQDKIAFHDVSKFETGLDLKIVIVHRSSLGKLEVYKNTD